MSAIIIPTTYFLINTIQRAVGFTRVKFLFNVLNSLWKAGAGLLRIGKVYVLGTRSTECIY